MQNVNSEASCMSVVSFNPVVNQQKEKLAIQLIRELGEIHKMPNDMNKVFRNEKWRERALGLASELTPN